MSIDRREQWRSLQETYRQMSEEELAHVAEEAYQLTDVAKEVLQYEITNRKLDLKLQLEPPLLEDECEQGSVSDDDREQPEDEFEEEAEGNFDPNDPSTFQLTVVRRVWDIEEARTAHRILTDAGIPSYLGDNNIEDPAFYEGRFDGGVDMKVCDVDYRWAASKLAYNWPNEPAPEEPLPVGIPLDIIPSAEKEPEYAISCPKCHSTEVVFEGRAGTTTGNDAFNANFEWHCPVCDHRWEDNGVEQPVAPAPSK